MNVIKIASEKVFILQNLNNKKAKMRKFIFLSLSKDIALIYRLLICKPLALQFGLSNVLSSGVLYNILRTDFDGLNKSERKNKVPTTVPF